MTADSHTNVPLTVRHRGRIGLAPASRGWTRRAFTLVELMVVAAIIILIVSIATPAIGPMLASNEKSSAISTLKGVLAAAQTAAAVKGTSVGVRIERAYRTNTDGFMIDSQGRTVLDAGFSGPVWLDHQQARILDFSTTKQYSFIFEPGSKVYELPAGAWVAPADYLRTDAAHNYNMSEAGLTFNPPSTPAVVPYNVFETFYVVFNAAGEISVFPYDWNWYSDRSQPILDSNNNLQPRYVPYMQNRNSALSLIVYNRKDYESIDPRDGDARRAFLINRAEPVFINRVTGAIIQGGT